jgi:prepilin-type N-terminal cleavage/methylation domain-containing protein
MSRRPNSAFTLVELLVALAIFALIAGFAYRGLQSMLDSREAMQKETRKWRDIALFVGRMERDFSAVIALPASGGVTRAWRRSRRRCPRWASAAWPSSVPGACCRRTCSPRRSASPGG